MWKSGFICILLTWLNVGWVRRKSAFTSPLTWRGKSCRGFLIVEPLPRTQSNCKNASEHCRKRWNVLKRESAISAQETLVLSPEVSWESRRNMSALLQPHVLDRTLLHGLSATGTGTGNKHQDPEQGVSSSTAKAVSSQHPTRFRNAVATVAPCWVITGPTALLTSFHPGADRSAAHSATAKDSETRMPVIAVNINNNN